ncbi:YicC family protein [candidate division WOR-3 bacterium]|nr:YicC family protein [candidate division WOR-3 bacterium]
MPSSMTGFANSEEILKDGSSLSVAIKSLNHRYLDVSLNAPREVSNMETEIAGIVAEKMKRGKITITVSIKNPSQINGGFSFDEKMARSTLDEILKLKETLGLKDSVLLEHVLQFNLNIQKEGQNPDEELWKTIKNTIEKTLSDLSEKRIEEGKKLAETISVYLSKIERSKDCIGNIAPSVVIEKKGKLLALLSDSIDSLLSARQDISDKDRIWFRNFVEARILTETAFLADKITINEELDRLNIHLQKFKEILKKDSPVGKQLDFLIQEMQREANTIASKAQKAEISLEVVQIKENLENIREQVQNIE